MPCTPWSLTPKTAAPPPSSPKSGTAWDNPAAQKTCSTSCWRTTRTTPKPGAPRGLVNWTTDYQAALSDFQTAWDLAGNMNLIAVDIATIEKDLRDYEAARDTLRQALEADPWNARALFRLGEIQIVADGNFTQAKLTLQDCIDFNPGYLHCHYMLGRAQDRLGETAEAAASFAKAIELGSQDARHHYWAGWSQIVLGNCGQAMRYLEPGLEIANENSQARLAADISAVIPECDPGFVAGA